MLQSRSMARPSATFAMPRSLVGSSLANFEQATKRAARGVAGFQAQPRDEDAMPPGMCPRCGMMGNHWAGPMACIDALRDRLSRFE
jgi:hypothetical protein